MCSIVLKIPGTVVIASHFIADVKSRIKSECM